MNYEVIYEIFSKVSGDKEQEKFIKNTIEFLKTCWLTKTHNKYKIEVRQLKTRINIYFMVPKRKNNG